MFSTLIGWLASHLVIASFVGFLFAGLQIFGAFGSRGEAGSSAAPEISRAEKRSPPADAQTPTAVEPRRESMQPDVPVTAKLAPETGRERSTFLAVEPAPPKPRDAKPVRQPKLIGGSLPIYSDGRAGPDQRVGDALAAERAGQFRPPGAETMFPAQAEPARDDLLQDARRAFWNGEFERAEQAYMTLISAFPTDADAFGELGNLYQAMGRQPAAMDAYYEAGLRLKANNDDEKLSQVIVLFEKEGDERLRDLRP